ncbi:MAG TPA: response regulator transcription factor [Pyrinomonadaceae bacterium]|nr:response regulator transcription factor [Pyrinomonadaceae bacterium]
MKRPRLLLADDHMMFSQGLQGLLEDEFDLVGAVGDGAALVEAACQLNPDVIVVDISMPVMNGFDAVRQLRKQGVTAKIIFLTMHADDRLLSEAFRCGGAGYVLKQSAGEDLVVAIREVLAGNRYVAPLIATEWVEDVSKRAQGTQKLTLTPRQREVLQLVIEGCTMKEIASRLGISTRTAESHKYEMMEGLGVETTAELIQYAVKLGLTSS